MIPVISRARLERLRAKMKPVMRLIEEEPGFFHEHPKGLLVYVEEKHPRQKSYYHTPRPVSLAKGLEVVGELVFYSEMGSFFRPSVSEVLSQLPADMEDIVIAYEAHPTYVFPCPVEDGLYKTTMRLYRGEGLGDV